MSEIKNPEEHFMTEDKLIEWADARTENPIVDPKIPDGMFDQWAKLTGLGAEPLPGELFNEIRDSMGRPTGITVIVRSIFGQQCVYVMDHAGEVDLIHASSIREAPFRLKGVRLVSGPDGCPTQTIEV